jgi:hypothetical protein
MAWTYEQQVRLQKEIEIVSQYFPKLGLVKVGTRDCLEGYMYTNSKKMYKIRLYIPTDLPYSVPEVVVTYPSPLKDYYNRDLTSLGASATMHLLSAKDGYPKICTYKADKWNSNVTFYKVLIKVRLWLEALDGHIRTGQQMDYFLQHQI